MRMFCGSRGWRWQCLVVSTNEVLPPMYFYVLYQEREGGATRRKLLTWKGGPSDSRLTAFPSVTRTFLVADGAYCDLSLTATLLNTLTCPRTAGQLSWLCFSLSLGLLITNLLICCAMVYQIKMVESTLPVEYLQRVGYLQVRQRNIIFGMQTLCNEIKGEPTLGCT